MKSKRIGVFLGSVFCFSMIVSGVCHDVLSNTKTLKKRVVFCNYELLLCNFLEDNSDDTTLVVREIDQADFSENLYFCYQNCDYKIVVNDFTLSRDGVLSLLVPFDDGKNYKANIKISRLSDLINSDGANRSVVLDDVMFSSLENG